VVESSWSREGSHVAVGFPSLLNLCNEEASLGWLSRSECPRKTRVSSTVCIKVGSPCVFVFGKLTPVFESHREEKI
jgi:hypothetical protein